jgi:hypothetical protein
VKTKCGLWAGGQVLDAVNIEAVAAADDAGLNFIRAEGNIFTHITDGG